MSLLLYLCVYCDHVLIYNSIGIWGLSINLITYLLAGNFFFFFFHLLSSISGNFLYHLNGKLENVQDVRLLISQLNVLY